MVTEKGQEYKDLAEFMAQQEPGTMKTYVDLDGYTRYTLRDADNSDGSGLYYAFRSLGARMARGDTVSEEEVDILVKRSNNLGIPTSREDVLKRLEQDKKIAESIIDFERKITLAHKK